MADPNARHKAMNRAKLADRVRQYPVEAERLQARLLDLSRSAPPASTDHGMCNDIVRFGDSNWAMNEMLVLGLRALTATAVDPLSDVFLAGDKWEGKRGKARRNLAGQVADLIDELS